MTQHETHGVSFVLGYTFAHALGESPDNWSFLSPINSANPREIYGTSQFDVRHRFTFSTTYNLPGKDGMGQLLKGWSLNSIVTLESATPWGVNDFTTDFSGTNEINSNSPNGEQWNFFGNPADFQTTKAFINTNGGAGGIPFFQPGTPPPSDPLGPTDPAFAINNPTCTGHSGAPGTLGYASLLDLGCYVSLNGKSVLVPPAYGSLGTTAPNMFRGFPYYNVDLNVTKVFKIKERLSFQFRAEFFNLFNHPEPRQSVRRSGRRQYIYRSKWRRGRKFRLPPHNPRRAQLQSGAWFRWSACDAVGLENSLLTRSTRIG